ncbi:SUMF1/EgtB/PvdO family nonheme iron enzyme [Micromonospora saelicesensis]|uniref:SUMF1/EgtB/PvdO family nonheme iron enzyme n=1 Tax=Micromonospora saelicesensis TaxID=285676 RepID=UPI003CECA969
MDEPESVSTEGGAFVNGDVNSGTFIGRDQIVVLTDYSQADLNQALAAVVSILRAPEASVRVAGRENRKTMALSGGGTHAVFSLDAAMALSSMTAENQSSYLASLVVNPLLRRWATQFVPLSGTVTVVEDPSGILELHPEFSILHARGEGAERRVFRERISDISTVAERYDAFVVLGEPGAGKTTVLSKLALEAAGSRLRGGTGYLPLMVTLADYRDHRDPFAFLVDQAQERLGDSISLRDLLAKGELLLVVDSINEMPHSSDHEFRQKIRAWRDFVKRWPKNQFIFSCRQRDYSEPLGVQQVEIDPLDDGRVRLFMEQYLGAAAAEAFWARVTSGRDDLLSLVRNPYLLTMLSAIYTFQGDLPTNRALLFTEFIEVLFRREMQKRDTGWPTKTVLFSALAQLAWSMLASGEGTRLSYSAMAGFLRQQVEDAPADAGFTPSDLIIQLGLATTLLESRTVADGDEEIFFYHHLLQEAMAAREMLRRWKAGEDLTPQFWAPRSVAEMPDPGSLGSSEPVPPPPSNGWEETTVLAAGLAGDPAAFIGTVLGVNPVLAARCVLEAGVGTPDVLRVQLRQDLHADLTDSGLHLRARIAAGNMLGALGDVRFEPVSAGEKMVIPSPMVEVTGGEAVIGSSRWTVRRLVREGHKYGSDEQPRHNVRLPPFRIGAFPVTNAEYRVFVEDGGYEGLEYWTGAGRAWLNGEHAGGGPPAEFLNLRRHLSVDPSALARWTQDPGASKAIAGWRALVTESDERALAELDEYYARRSRRHPAFWEDERYGRPNHPVVGVTWYESDAYCAWLAARLRSAGLLPDEFVVRLPTEAEWEFSARGPNGRRYPWGRNWTSMHANTRDGQILEPTPVGAYAQGRSVFGCADMSGNVWEWTHSLHRPYPYALADGREDPEDSGCRVVRGSSWIDPPAYARSAYRGRHPPDFFDYDQGFRTVISRRLE